jgi:hypothetical protein
MKHSTFIVFVLGVAGAIVVAPATAGESVVRSPSALRRELIPAAAPDYNDRYTDLKTDDSASRRLASEPNPEPKEEIKEVPADANETPPSKTHP